MIAVGDHQVSNYASEVMARTLGMSTNQTPVDEGRWPDYDILWNVPRLSASDYPFHGNNVIYFDGGPPRPEPGNPSKTIGTDVPPSPTFEPFGPGSARSSRRASVAVEMTSTFRSRTATSATSAHPRLLRRRLGRQPAVTGGNGFREKAPVRKRPGLSLFRGPGGRSSGCRGAARP